MHLNLEMDGLRQQRATLGSIPWTPTYPNEQQDLVNSFHIFTVWISQVYSGDTTGTHCGVLLL